VLRGVLSVLLREWGKFLPQPLAELVRLGVSASLMLGVTGPSGHDFSEVSFQALASQLTRAQAVSEARDAVRITPTFNYSQQPAQALSLDLIPCPFPEAEVLPAAESCCPSEAQAPPSFPLPAKCHPREPGSTGR